VNRPQSVEGRLVWGLAGRLTGAVRRDPAGEFDGFDLPSAFAMAAALSIPAAAVAELMPPIDAGFRRAAREAAKRRREEDAEAQT
jgi:hypothetical protein